MRAWVERLAHFDSFLEAQVCRATWSRTCTWFFFFFFKSFNFISFNFIIDYKIINPINFMIIVIDLTSQATKPGSIQYIFVSIFFLKKDVLLEIFFEAFDFFELVFMVYLVLIYVGLVCSKLLFTRLSQFYDLDHRFNKLTRVDSIINLVNIFF